MEDYMNELMKLKKHIELLQKQGKGSEVVKLTPRFNELYAQYNFNFWIGEPVYTHYEGKIIKTNICMIGPKNIFAVLTPRGVGAERIGFDLKKVEPDGAPMFTEQLNLF